MLNVAYPDIRTQLDEAIKESRIQKYFSDLLNLRDIFEFYIPVIRDYSAALHSNDWNSIFSMQLKIFWVILSLERSPFLYVRALLLHFSQLEYFKDKLPQIYTVITQNPSSFNEEEGEIALSVLAHSVVTDNFKSKINKLSTNFQLIHLYRQISSESDKDFDNHITLRRLQHVETTGTIRNLISNHLTLVIHRMTAPYETWRFSVLEDISISRNVLFIS